MVEGYEWVFILCGIFSGLSVLMVIHEGWTMVQERRSRGPMSARWTRSPRRVPIRVPGTARVHRHVAPRVRRR